MCLNRYTMYACHVLVYVCIHKAIKMKPFIKIEEYFNANALITASPGALIIMQSTYQGCNVILLLLPFHLSEVLYMEITF